MKAKYFRRSFLAISAAALPMMMAPALHADVYYWDTNGTDAGLGDTAGTWGSSAFQVSGFPSFSLIDGTFDGFSNTATTSADQIHFGTHTLALGTTASTIGIDGGGVTINRITFGAGQGAQGVTLGGGGGSITLAGTTPAILAANTGINTIGAELAGTAGITKTGSGAAVLTAANTITGGLTLAGGTLQVGNSTSGSLVSQALTFNGTGTFRVQQADASTQNMGLLALNVGDATITSTAASGSATQTVTFSSLAAPSAGATANFTLAGNTSETQNKIVLSDTANAPLDNAGSNNPGLFFGGTEYARYYTDGPYFTPVLYGVDVNASSTQGTSTSGITVTTGAAADVKLTGAITNQDSVTLNTLNMGANSLTLTDTSQALSVNGILATGGTLGTAGRLQPATAGGELVVRVHSGTMVVNPIIQNNTSASSLTKSGAGTLQLNSINTYSGPSHINAGTVDVRAGTAGGSAVWGGGDIAINQGSTLFFNPAAQAVQNTPGFSVPVAITLSGGAGTSNLRFAGNDNKFVLSGGITGQAGVAQTLAIRQGNLNPNNGDRMTTQFTGAIADGAGGSLGLSIDFFGSSGTGQRSYTNLAGQNTFTGDLTITNSRGMNGGGTHPGAWVTIGGLRHDSFNVGTLVQEGTGYLGTGADYSGNISVSNGSGGRTTLSFLTSANQILRGVISGTGSLHQQGAGTVTLINANTFSGNTTIIAASGGIRLGDGGTTGALTGISGITNNGSLTINRSNGFTQATDLNDRAITGTGSFTQAGAGTTILSLANTFSGNTTVANGTLTLENNLALQNSALVTTGGGVVTLGASATTPTFGGLSGASGNLASVISSGYSGVTALTFNPTTGSVTYGGIIADGASGTTLTKTGAGTQVLAGGNTYTGATTISAGVLEVSTVANAGVASGIGAYAGTDRDGLVLSGGTFRYTGTTDGTTNRGFRTTAAAAINISQPNVKLSLGDFQSTGSTLTVSGASGSSLVVDRYVVGSNLVLTPNIPVRINEVLYTVSPASNAFGPNISPAAGSSIVTVGQVKTSIASGNTNVVFGGAGGGIIDTSVEIGTGQFRLSTPLNWTFTGNTFIAGNISLNNGTFRVGGAGTLGTAGAWAGNINHEGAGRTFAYASSANQLLSGNITGAGNLVQSGTGTLTISGGAKTYTGTTTISNGTLALGANNVLPDASKVTLGTATLNAATFTDTCGTLAVNGTATLNLGSGGALAFANSSAVTWTGTLNITGTFVPSASIRFGTTSAGLTFGQLANISVNGSGAGSYSLDANGFLTDAAGSPFAAWSGGADFDADANGDGVANGLAWVLGAPNVGANALGLLPTLDNSDPTYLIFNFRRKDEANTDSGTTIAAQYGTNLVSWNNAVDNGTTILITPFDEFHGPGVDKVEVKISRSLAVGGKLFIRLSATAN